MKKTLLTLAFPLCAMFAAAQGSKTFTDDLVVSINGTSTDPMPAEISVTEQGDGTCDISLANFQLVSDGDALPVGNIELTGIQIEEKDGWNHFTTSQTIQIAPGDDDTKEWLGPMLGDVPVNMTGTYNDDRFHCTIDIYMEMLEQDIHVTFGYDPAVYESVKNYKDMLTVTIDGESTEPQEAGIRVGKLVTGSYELALQNFMLSADGDVLHVGNITLTGVQAEDMGAYTAIATKQTIQIEPGNYDAEWIGPILGDVPIDMTGKFTAEQLYCTIDIDMSGTLGQVIHVTFGDVSTAIRPTLAATRDDLVDVYAVNGVCLRRHVAPADALSGLGRGIYIVGGKKVIK